MPRVDRDGTVHLPAFAVPLSRYMSEKARVRYIERAFDGKERLPRGDWNDPAFLLRVRQWSDSRWYRPRAELAKSMFRVNVVEQTIAGIRTYVLTPREGVSADNEQRVLINLHGGSMVAGAKWGSIAESAPISAIGKLKVISVDYRMAPEHKFPAASEDIAAVYAELLKTYRPENVGIYGWSAGGMLSGMIVSWLLEKRLPLPGAIGIFSSGILDSQLVGGDSIFLMRGIDGSLFPLSTAPKSAYPRSEWGYYLRDVNPSDPLFAPGSYEAIVAKYPPTLIIVGGRDAMLSAAVRSHTQLVNAGVEAYLHVWDGMGHSFLLDIDLPESRQAYNVITKFFDRHLGL